jgi:putative heme-binding domain-containing protein
VFALYRINSNESIKAVRNGLNDKDLQIRVATARVMGLAKDSGSIEQLTQMIQNDDPACRRQAATALGQIGESGTIPILLNAADGVTDRFVEHAIIYALISMNQADLVKHRLTDPSPDIRKAALIALDQMQNKSLTAEQVTPFLASNDSILESTARWVVSHHPEWSNNMITYLQNQLNKAKLEVGDKEQLKDILVSYCGDASMQKFILTQMQRASVEKKLFILEAMNDCNINEVPAGWIAQFEKELTLNVNETVQLNVLKFIRLHGITSLTDALEQVADNNQNVPTIRINAIGTSLNDSTQLSNKHFDFLYAQLQPGNDASIRQQAANVLGQAKLSNELLLKVAKDFLGKADAFILPRLIPMFQGAKDIEIGKSLATALGNSTILDNITEENLQEMFSNYPPELNATTEKLLAKLKPVRTERLSRIQTIESGILKGDIERGRILFFSKAICNTCHTIGNEGGNFGPDLTSIQRDRSPHDLIEAIVYPGVSFVREYETYQINTKNNTFTGIIQEQTADEIRLGISPLESVQIQRKDVTLTEIQNVSMMPLGLDKLLTEQELADLMAFMLGQDQDPETDAELLRKQNQ